jgi:hypothetical protein
MPLNEKKIQPRSRCFDYFPNKFLAFFQSLTGFDRF